MRRLPRRKAVTIIAAVISFTTIPAAGIVATATPALAFVYICNSSGNYCLGAPTIHSGDEVMLTSTGREITEVDRHWTCCSGFEVFQLKFTADTTKCVGVTDTLTAVTVRDCSGGDSNNTNWAWDPQGDGSTKWISTTKLMLLGSDNTLYHQLFVQTSCSGCYFRWTN